MGHAATLPFKPSDVLKRDAHRAAFASKQFAANRAGFLLREYARQIIEPPVETNTVVEPAEVNPFDESTSQMDEHSESSAESIAARQLKALEALKEQTAEFSAEAVGTQIEQAYQAGRSAALYEMQSVIDQAMIALTAAAEAFSSRYDALERECVIPVAKSGIELAGLLARRSLATPEAMQAYLDQVVTSLTTTDNSSSITVRMNPADCQLLSKSLPKDSALKLVEDAQVSAGGVLVFGGDQVIDDRFERRLREVQEAALTIAQDVLRDHAS